ncbi:hypothetical protein RF11_03071 [Thelohanellus kitauei]|uniref:Uncharacterized protein n=1 Tax=Thelohanellus kitauei TaxID=669202 RepID=A0A0C2JXD7_THEKT|nr:hypothetical protein RF11_03071 [Thelohanellus kitauei]
MKQPNQKRPKQTPAPVKRGSKQKVTGDPFFEGQPEQNKPIKHEKVATAAKQSSRRLRRTAQGDVNLRSKVVPIFFKVSFLAAVVFLYFPWGWLFGNSDSKFIEFHSRIRVSLDKRVEFFHDKYFYPLWKTYFTAGIISLSTMVSRGLVHILSFIDTVTELFWHISVFLMEYFKNVIEVLQLFFDRYMLVIGKAITDIEYFKII